MTKITLITGVAGTTGSQILDYLSEQEEILSGERVVVGIDNFFRGTRDNIARHLDNENFENFIFINKDFIEALEDLERFKPGEFEVDEVYHMAAVVPTKYFYESPDLTYEVNCKGTIDLFNWCLSKGVKRFIVGSSSEIYGHIDDKDLPATESTMSRFDSEESSTRWSYAEGKLLTEHYLNHFKDRMERICHLRFANTYGVRDLDDNHVLPYFINAVVKGCDTIHVSKDAQHLRRTFLNNRDSARACVELMRKGRNGVAYNVGSQEEISILGLLIKVISIYEEVTGKVYDGRIVNDIVRPGDPRRRVLDTTRLRKHTGFTPCVSLDEGIREMIEEVLRRNSKE